MGLLFIIVLALGGGLWYLSGRVSRLEKEVWSLKLELTPGSEQAESPLYTKEAMGEMGTPAMPPAADPYAAREAAMGVAPPPPRPYEPAEPGEISHFFMWLKEDFFVKLGAFLLIIAFGWFVNYAFANDWIGPMGRVTLGIIIGALVMTLGLWRIPTHKHQGGIFTALGATIIILTVFAAQEVYNFFPPAIALFVMFMAVLFVAFVSVRYNSPRLAVAGLILAGVAPFLTNPPEPDVLLLFSYLMVVVVGTLWVVRTTGSNVLTFAALVLTFFYSFPIWGAGGREEELIGLLFAFAFTTIFFVSNIVGILVRKTPTARGGQIATAIGTGLLLFSWIAIAAPEQWQSLLYIAWMLVFSSGAFVVYVHTNYRVPFYIYSAIGIGLLAAATATELDGALLTIAFTFEAAAIVLMTLILMRDVQVAQRLTFLFIAPIVLSFEHMIDPAWRSGFLHEHFFALLVLAGALLVTALVLLGAKKEGEDTPVAAPVMSIGGVVYLLILVWLVTHAIMTDSSAIFVSLVIYTILGLAFFIRGRHEDDKPLLTMGGVQLGFVVARLLLIDVWNMELFGRVITFGSIGVLLMSTAFIGKGKKADLTEE